MRRKRANHVQPTQLKVQHQCLQMPVVAWKLLGEYLTVVNYDRSFRDRRSKVNYTELAGAILSRFLMTHGEGIRRAAQEVRLAVTREPFAGFYSPAQLAAIARATGSDIPDVYRIGYTPGGPADPAAIRALRVIAGRSKGAAARPTKQPRKVRTRGGRTSTGPRRRQKRTRRTEHSTI